MMMLIPSRSILLLCCLAYSVRADVPELPAVPADKSTPVQQRLGYHGATSYVALLSDLP